MKEGEGYKRVKRATKSYGDVRVKRWRLGQERGGAVDVWRAG